MDKHSSLLQKSVNYGRENLYSIGPRWMDRVFENVQLRMIRVKDLKAEGKKLRKRIFFLDFCFRDQNNTKRSV